VAWTAHDRVGRYRLLSKVGDGRDCEVWDAIDDQSGDRRALKVLRDEVGVLRGHVALMRHEFSVGRGLDHPNVIHIYEFNVVRGATFLVLELFPVPNLKTLSLPKNGGVEAIAFRVHQIAEQAATALGYLHEQGWIHRDVKPDNFLMDRQGMVKMIDLALAERRKAGLGKLFGGRGKVQGTRSYMSPEQIRGKVVDERSDIYSLACMLHELVAGKPPFTGANTEELLNKHLRTLPPPLEASGRDVSPEFAEFIRQMLSKEPAKRPQNMKDVLRILRGMKIFNRTPAEPILKTSG
jgi:eukaryotic-like serine/threonine-protein kinase